MVIKPRPTVARIAPIATIPLGFFLKITQTRIGVKITYSPVTKLVMAAVESTRPMVWVTYENPRIAPKTAP